MRPLFGKSKSKDIDFYEFEKLDEQQIKKELKIYQRAKENGIINLPASDSNDRDNVQNEIISYFESLRDVNSTRLNDSIKAWHNEISALKLSLDFARLESIPRKLDTNYDGLKCRGKIYENELFKMR